MNSFYLASGGTWEVYNTCFNRVEKIFDKMKLVGDTTLHTARLNTASFLDFDDEKILDDLRSDRFDEKYFFGAAANYAITRSGNQNGGVILLFSYPSCFLDTIDYNIEPTNDSTFYEIRPGVLKVERVFCVRDFSYGTGKKPLVPLSLELERLI